MNFTFLKNQYMMVEYKGALDVKAKLSGQLELGMRTSFFFKYVVD